ncbi:helix-turn-helix domain-containing protein [bacterium]|nr:helix-turn-helix domain-containing protein [bacterium]
MKINFFKEFADQLKGMREQRGVTLHAVALATRLNVEFLKKIESGDFGFASDVYIKGYLRKYARELEIDEEWVMRQYDFINEKIEFLAYDHHLPVPVLREKAVLQKEFIPEILNADDSAVSLFSDEIQAIEKELNAQTVSPQLDRAVIEKIEKQRRINAVVIGSSVILVLIALLQLVFAEGTIKRADDITLQDETRETVSKKELLMKRARLNLSQPIVPPKEKLLREEYARKLLKERIEISKNYVNERSDRKNLKPIPVKDAAKDLERTIQQ